MVRLGRLPPTDKLETAIAQNFKGGLNTFDTPLNMSSRFCTELENLYPDSNGRLLVRFGTTLFADATAAVGQIINLTYYNGALIVVGDTGRIASVNSAGVVTQRFNAAIAAALPGAPSAWNVTTFASFAQFKGELIICNGADKPVLCKPTFACSYLQDLATGSNVNIPRARYVAAHNNYLVLCVSPTDTNTLYISMKGTSGTYFGDPGPDNDGVNFSMANFITQGSIAITGISAFRDELIVAFREANASVKLGEYTATNHVPRVTDMIPAHGSVSHRTMVPLGDDLLLMDAVGVTSLQRAQISKSLTPQLKTALIGVDVQKALSIFTLSQLSDRIFSVHDRLNQHVLFFVPNAVTQTDCKVFVLCADKSQRFEAWTTFSQMNYVAGTRSEEGRVFLARADGKIYYYRNLFEPLYSDYSILGQQPWSDDTNWSDNTGWTDASSFIGTAIPWVMATPDSDFRDRVSSKHSRYLHMTMEGNAGYTVAMFNDRARVANLSMSFTQTSEPQKSNAVALRPTNNGQLYAWPAKFIRTKLRVSGTASAFVTIVAVGLLYLKGTIRR